MNDPITNLLTRGVEQIYPNREALEKVLRSGKKLKLYQGFDPSMPSLHLGNFVGLMKLRQFQQLGHEVIFLVGDFTGMIGDPTDKLATRKPLTREQVTQNAANWKHQAENILDFNGTNPVKILQNSEWLDKVTFKDLIDITSNFTVQQMIERDMFQVRIKDGKPIHLHEFLYPIAQGMDSVFMDVDLEIAGSDQLFNMLAGRTLMKALKNKEKYVLTTKLLVDAKGDKVGKTTGNALFLDSTPKDFYGGIMSFPDEVIALGFELLTELPWQGLEKQITKYPMGEKKRLAFEVVKLLWGETQAIEAQTHFENVYQKGKMPVEIPICEVRSDLPAGLSADETGEAGKWEAGRLIVEVGLAKSQSEAKRLIQQKAVELNGLLIADHRSLITVKNGDILKVGKTRYVKLTVK